MTSTPELARSKATSLDYASNELSERVGNGIHPNSSSISENSSHASPSSEARSDLGNNGTLASSKETSGYVVNGQSTEVKPINSQTSRFLASILAHYSANVFAQSLPFYESSSNGKAH